MILLLDVGNTQVKWRCHDAADAAAPRQGAAPRPTLAELLDTLAESCPGASVWVSSVAGAEFDRELRTLLAGRWRRAPWFAASEAAALGLRNSYRRPGQLGVDRWLAMLAAWKERQSGVCVVDSGSALTIDFVAADGQHLGGYIIPGLESMRRVLLSDTGRVFSGTDPRAALAAASSTESAVDNGLLLAHTGAVSLALQRSDGDFALVFSGGNGAALQRALGLGGSYWETLVLDGLYLLGQARAGGGGPARE